MAAGVRPFLRRLTPVSLASVLLFALGGGACGSGRAVESKALVPRSPGDLVNTRWILVTTGDSDEVPASTPFTLDIADGTASGTGPCNRYQLPFSHEGEDVTTGAVASTRIACAQPLAAAEQRYFQQLEKVDTAQKQGTEDQLVLTGPHDIRLAYESADRSASDLAGTWDIVNYAAPNALTTPVKGTQPTLHFGSDDSLTIETGCNTGNSTWEANGQSLTIAAPRSTLKGCPTPAGLTQQESSIFTALPHTSTVDLGDRDAVLLDAAGSALFVLEKKS
jgi:heat shock protein HslJ